MEATIDAVAEAYIRELSDEMVRPRDGECLACFVDRMLNEFGCDHTLRFARAYRDARAPRATALEERLGRGGGFCDCEIFYNAIAPAAHLWVGGGWVESSDGEEEWVEPALPVPLPPCLGARSGSTKPCGHWHHQRRY